MTQNFKVGDQSASSEINTILEKLSKLDNAQKMLEDGGVDSTEAPQILTIARHQIVLQKPAVSSEETETLQQYFSKVFPTIDFSYRTFLRFSPSPTTISLNPAFVKPGFEGVLALIKTNQYTFIGENHLVDDENLFREKIPELKAQGIKFIAVELEDTAQDKLNHYLNTGDPAGLEREIAAFPDFFALMVAAHNVGIKVVCVDEPFEQQDAQNPEKREQYIADNLSKLKGKGIVWLGTAHAANDRQPFRSVRTILEDDGKTTAGIKFESKAGDLALAQMSVRDYRIQAALNLFYPFSSPTEVTGYSTEGLQGFSCTDMTHPDLNHTLFYSEAFDLVLFLPEEYSKQSVFP